MRVAPAAGATKPRSLELMMRVITPVLGLAVLFAVFTPYYAPKKPE